jgi:hypothetical protein
MLWRMSSSYAAHYGRALHCWIETFIATFDGKIWPTMLQENPNMTKA